ncbi:ABC transporter permease [Halobacillus litoralis]|uniref:ABC transporter permease n=1 Tax=Halobacillus litoralis TaxID=45668 RepID=UPI00136F6878|nr:ABC transporter permease [Halobacillus litoralis]MYL36382.1 ABC transporter permease subunit [Halobacillus litoralis]
MTFSMKRIYAIFQKDLKELYRNLFVSSTIILPIMMAFMMSQAESVTTASVTLVITLSFAAVGTFVQSAMIAEEKEKNTLRSLMMSPASTLDILAGKSLVTFVMTLATLIVSLLIVGYSIQEPVWMTGMLLLLLVFYITLGTLIGLLTRTLIEASVVLMPILLLFGMNVTFEPLMASYEFLSFLEYLPNYQIQLFIEDLGQRISWVPAGIIAIWTVVTLMVTVGVYKRTFTS